MYSTRPARLAKGDSPHWEIARVGTEPVVLWGRDEENDLPRWTIILGGWRFVGPHGGYWFIGTPDETGSVSATVTHGEDGKPLVPSDPEPDLEHGAIRFCVGFGFDGYTIADLREIARSETRLKRLWRWWKYGGDP